MKPTLYEVLTLEEIKRLGQYSTNVSEHTTISSLTVFQLTTLHLVLERRKECDYITASVLNEILTRCHEKKLSIYMD